MANISSTTAVPFCSSEQRGGTKSVARTHWRNAVIGALFTAWAVWIVQDAFTDIAKLGWNDPESSQVLLAPLVFLWLAWLARKRLSECSFSGRWTGACLLAVGWMLWIQGYHYQVQSFWHLGAILVVVGTVITLLGKDLFWKFLPAWAALTFLIPIPGRVHQHIAIPLEQVTAIMTQSVAEVLGINSSRSGNQLNVNGVDICIAEACNGLRMVITLFLACYVFAFVKPLQWWVRLIVLAASPLIAIVCNVVRLVPTLWMFGHCSNRTAERFHDLAGWAMLLMAFGLLTAMANVMHWIGLPVYTKSLRKPSENGIFAATG